MNADNEEIENVIHQNNDKSRTYNSTLNIALGLFNKMVTIVLAFISRAVFVQVLSVDYLGINGLFADVLTMLSLADLGFSTAMSYSFYKPLAERDERKIASLITFYRKVYNVIAIAVAVIGVALLPFINLIVNVDTQISYLRVYYLLSLMNTVISYLFVYKSSIIAADQKNYIVTKYSVWIGIAKTIIQTVLLYVTHNYFIYLGINIVATLGYNLLVSYKADKNYPYIKKRVELAVEEKNAIYKNLSSVFLYKVSTVVFNGTDNIIISVIVGTSFVGLYSNYNTIISNQLGSIIVILFGSLTASIGNLVVKEDVKKRFEVFKTMQMVSFWLSGIFITCLYFLTQDFITLWIGSQYLLGRDTLIVILLNFYIMVTFNPIWSYRDATGLYQKIKYVLLITTVVNVVLSIILGKIMGITGVLLATAIAKLSTYFWYEPKLLYRDFFNKKAGSYYLGHLVNCTMIILSIAITTIILPTYKEVTVINWLIRAVICGIVSFVIYLIRYCKTEEFIFVLERCKRVLVKISKVKVISLFLILTLTSTLTLTSCKALGEQVKVTDETQEYQNDTFETAQKAIASINIGWNLGNSFECFDLKHYDSQKDYLKSYDYQIMAVYETKNWSGWDASNTPYFDKNLHCNLEWEINSLNSDINGDSGRFLIQLINNKIGDTGDSKLSVDITEALFYKKDGTVVKLSELKGKHELVLEGGKTPYIEMNIGNIALLKKASDILVGKLILNADLVKLAEPIEKNPGISNEEYYETLWGNPVTTRAMIEEVANAGFKAVRIPITYYDHIDSNGKINRDWLKRVSEVVNYVIDNNMYCIINIHHDTGEDGWIKAEYSELETNKERLHCVWQQIATYFMNHDDKLLFEGFNEILNNKNQWNNAGGDSYKASNELNQEFVDTVRETGGNNKYRNLIVSTYAAGTSEEIVNAFELPKDISKNHIITQVHYYSNLEETKDMPNVLSRLNTKFKESNTPVIIGEFATWNNWEESKAIQYMKTFITEAKVYKYAVLWWDRGNEHQTDKSQTETLLNRNQLTWYDKELMNALIETSNQ
jgi:O-antigen/teichoic acid export membrane protein/aryl-phospho-beta-D-glucosidase BglC (GH1 family)